VRPQAEQESIFGEIMEIWTVGVVRAGLTIRGAHTNVRRGPLSGTRSQDFLICGGALFPPKVDDLF